MPVLAPTQITPSTEPCDSRCWGEGVPAAANRAAVRGLVRRVFWCRRKERGWGSVVGCGLPRPGVGRVLVVGGVLAGGQLQACRSPLRCAWCGDPQWVEFAGRAGGWVSGAVGAGGFVVHSVLTLPHGRRDRLDVLLGWLFEAWSGLRHLAGVRRARGAVGWVRPIVVVQIKWSSSSGWSPHLHVVWVCEGDWEAAGALSEAVLAGWRSRVFAVSGRRPSRSGLSSSMLEVADSVIPYLEPNSPHHPASNPDDSRHGQFCSGCPFCDPQNTELWEGDGWTGGRGLEVWSELGRLAVAGDRRSMGLVGEYMEATLGRRRWLFSTDLAARYGLPGELPDDGQIVGRERGVFLDAGLVQRLVWRDKSGGSWLREGAGLVDPDVSAEFFGDRLGERVTVGVAEDGSPCISLSG